MPSRKGLRIFPKGSLLRYLFSTTNPTSKGAAKKEAKRLKKGLKLAAKGPKATPRKPGPKSTRDVDTTVFINATPKGGKKRYYSFILVHWPYIYLL